MHCEWFKCTWTETMSNQVSKIPPEAPTKGWAKPNDQAIELIPSNGIPQYGSPVIKQYLVRKRIRKILNNHWLSSFRPSIVSAYNLCKEHKRKRIRERAVPRQILFRRSTTLWGFGLQLNRCNLRLNCCHISTMPWSFSSRDLWKNMSSESSINRYWSSGISTSPNIGIT